VVIPPPGRPAHPDTGPALDEVADLLGDRVRRDHALGALSTYRVGGPAALFLEANAEDDLLAVRAALVGRAVPVLVLGRGSNLLVADAGFPGLVVHLGPGFEALELAEGPAGSTVVRAGAALGLPVLARRSVEAGLHGLEWGVGVPGSVGGALRMNAGGHGSDIAACLVRYRWLDLSGDWVGESPARRLALGYRTSSVLPTHVVLAAEFSLRPGDRAAGQATLRQIVRWRRQHQPGGSNAGSVFTNPPGDSAGRLVEAAGLKGTRLGTAQVSTKHANFIQADEHGSADDVSALIDHVARVVHERLGIELRPEVRRVGFASDQTGAAPTDEQSEGR
jgi:UDP-N-acetylmuramate dehydrogenase